MTVNFDVMVTGERGSGSTCGTGSSDSERSNGESIRQSCRMKQA